MEDEDENFNDNYNSASTLNNLAHNHGLGGGGSQGTYSNYGNPYGGGPSIKKS